VSQSDNIELGGTWQHKQNSGLEWQLVYRDFQVESINPNQLETPNRSFIGTLDHKLRILDNGINLNTYYESNAGQEPKIEFQFVQVQLGEGSYLWNDYNEDGIQQINEFEIAPFSDLAGFEKISVFNNEFISINRNVLNQSLKIDPKKILKNKKHFLSRSFFSSRYRIDQKNLNADNSSLFNFLNFAFDSINTVSYNASFDHSLYINRGVPGWDLQLSYRLINNKLLQISGFDQRSTKEYYSRIRLNIKRRFDALLETSVGHRDRNSEIFSSQIFKIEYWRLTPQLNFRPNSKMRLVLKYKIEKNQNVLGVANENAFVLDGGLDLTWRRSQLSNFQFKFNYVNINFVGPNNSPIEFEMLQGLKNGKNVLWNVNYTKRISNSIDMIISYNGRKSEKSPLINTATVQMRAIF
jgi:hypothetical protein